MRKKPRETGREHGKEIGKHKPIGTAKGRYGMGCDAGKVIKIHDQDNWTNQDHGLWTLTITIFFAAEHQQEEIRRNIFVKQIKN